MSSMRSIGAAFEPRIVEYLSSPSAISPYRSRAGRVLLLLPRLPPHIGSEASPCREQVSDRYCDRGRMCRLLRVTRMRPHVDGSRRLSWGSVGVRRGPGRKPLQLLQEASATRHQALGAFESSQARRCGAVAGFSSGLDSLSTTVVYPSAPDAPRGKLAGGKRPSNGHNAAGEGHKKSLTPRPSPPHPLRGHRRRMRGEDGYRARARDGRVCGRKASARAERSLESP